MDIVKERKRRLQLYLGLLGFIIAVLLPSPEGLPTQGKNILVLLLFQLYLLVTRVLPFGVVGLLPMFCIPLFGIVGPSVDPELLKSSLSGFSQDIMFLVIAGFMIGGAMEKWNLHKRVSYTIAGAIGNSPSTILLGFMTATCLISMFLTNTATVVMMMPIALAFLRATGIEQGNLFAAALVSSISYSANMGGVGTPTGSSLSAGAIGLIPELTGHEFTYSMYLALGVPYVVVSVFCAWLILNWIYKPNQAPGTENLNKETLINAKRELGPITKPEIYISIILLLMFFGLLTRPFFWGKYLPLIKDGTFLTVLAFLMFIIPATEKEMLYTWNDAAKDIEWGMVFMIGGFLTIAGLLGPAGVTDYLASILTRLGGLGPWQSAYILGAVTNFLSNFGVNMFVALPLAHAVAEGLGASLSLILFTVTCVAQLNISLPDRATNAMPIGTGYATPAQMIKGGILISISNVILAPLVIRLITMGIFGVGVGW